LFVLIYLSSLTETKITSSAKIWFDFVQEVNSHFLLNVL